MWVVKRKGRWEGRRKIIGQKKNELIVALYVWFWYLKIDYHPLVGLPKNKSIIICEFIVLPNKRWVCPASRRGANKKPTKKIDEIGRWEGGRKKIQRKITDELFTNCFIRSRD